ncbi:MAG TPA: asparagine synthase (glutamine-hydrolyzing) [Vicinamibacterales bacterium]|nr:asparagine synthase (glutamine-hydrolyzing) [Vicinamibacterales bacterium]
MCGIAGFVESSATASPFTPDERHGLVHRMCDVIRHRGPDDEGVWVDDGVALGMRRLSIIDLSTGHQPIHNEDRTVWIVFNGEIYNFPELRRELEAAGHRFYTSTDTEAIVHAYEQWGTQAIRRLRGMFGLAIWDTRSKSLLVARDRAGIKPIYYAETGGRLYFGSELKSLLEAPDLPRDLDLDALDHYLSFLYTPRDGSIFKSVRKLPPGHLMTWRDGRLTIEQYWQLSANETFRGSEAEAVAQLRGVLTDAVRGHLLSDVPLGAFLSGGIDSSLVVGLMSEVSGARVKTFSIGFDEPAFDELEHARTVARHFGTDHHEFVVKPDAIGILDRLVWHFDEPFADSSAIPTWYVSEMARRHVTVVLSGDGGDELFGGYDRYVPHPRVVAFDRYSPRALRRVAAIAAARLPHGARGKNFLRHVGRDEQGRYLDAIRFFGSDEKPALLTSDVRRELHGPDPETRLARHFERFAQLPWPSQMMRFDAETYLPEDVLTKVDRMSMAHSIESRVPLLDNEVIDFAATLPASLKIKHGRRKHVLKEVAATLLPRAILDRRKQGFGVPLGTWFRGNLRELFADTLLSPSSLQRGYFEPAFVRQIVDEHLAARRDHTLRLWQLVVFERWCQQYLGGKTASISAERNSLPLSAPSLPSAGVAQSRGR